MHRRKGRRKPTAAQARHRAAGRQWTPVWQGDGEASAAVVAGGLEAVGIEALTQGTDATAYARVRDGFGSWAVLVPLSRVDDAREHLEQAGEAANILRPGVSRPEWRASIAFVAVLVLVALVAIAASEWL